MLGMFTAQDGRYRLADEEYGETPLALAKNLPVKPCGVLSFGIMHCLVGDARASGLG